MILRRTFLFLVIFIFLSSCSIIGIKPVDRRAADPDDDTITRNKNKIESLYKKLNILSLDEIPEEDYAEFSKYVQNGIAYVMVHPSYYTFFHNYNKKKILIDRTEANLPKNIVDIFIEDYPIGKRKMIGRMKESARKERNFIRGMARNKRFLILVLPPNYQNHPEYPYKKLDEFARYLNEVTGGSPSVIYMESAGFKRGTINSMILPRLNRLLHASGVKRLYLGGGYVDLCLRDFYDDSGRLRDIDKVEIVDEICTDSPDLMEEEDEQ